MAGSARDIFNRLAFGDTVKIRTPSERELLSLRAALRTLKRKYNGGDGVAITGLALDGEIVMAKDPEDPTITVISVTRRQQRAKTFEILSHG